MAETATASLESEVVELPPAPPAQVVRLKLRKPKPQKKVDWSSDTVDNEHMNKKKSKCCCVYVKPHKFGESSSESDDECEHCRGHVEMKKKRGHCGGDDDQQVPIQASSDDHSKT